MVACVRFQTRKQASADRTLSETGGTPANRVSCDSSHIIYLWPSYLSCCETQEKCLLEELDVMDASESGQQSIESGFETETWRSSDQEELETPTRDEGVSAAGAANVTLEWSRFMNSTEEVFKYMHQATAEILDANKLEPPSPHKEPTTRDSSTTETARIGPVCSSTGGILHSSNNPSEATNRHTMIPPQLHYEDVKLLAPRSRTMNGLSAPNRPVSTQSTTAEHDHAAEKISERDADAAEVPVPGAGRCVREGADTSHSHYSPPGASGVSGGIPGRGAGHVPDKSSSAASPPREAIPATDMLISTASKDNVEGDRSAQNMSFSLVDNGDEYTSGATEPELPLEASLVSASQQQKSGRAHMIGGTSMIAQSFSRVEVITSVGEAEVARRVEREKARFMAARQQRREESIKK